MKKFLLTFLIIAFCATPVFAREVVHGKGKPAPVVNNITNVTNVTNVEDSHNAFDFGAYLDAIFLETPATEWGIKTTYLAEGSETRVYAGGKVYFNRLLKKK
jgi:hypothetical protein